MNVSSNIFHNNVVKHKDGYDNNQHAYKFLPCWSVDPEQRLDVVERVRLPEGGSD